MLLTTAVTLLVTSGRCRAATHSASAGRIGQTQAAATPARCPKNGSRCKCRLCTACGLPFAPACTLAINDGEHVPAMTTANAGWCKIDIRTAKRPFTRLRFPAQTRLTRDLPSKAPSPDRKMELRALLFRAKRA